jgi:CheY-like chemotaxis protein
MSVHVSSEQNEATSRTRATDGELHPLTDVAHLLDQAKTQLPVAGRDNARVRAELTTRIESLQKSAEPLMDGLEACRALRADEATRDIPIIMVTTRSEADSLERNHLDVCNGYVTKPIDGSELLSKIKKLLATSRCPIQAGVKPRNPLGFSASVPYSPCVATEELAIALAAVGRIVLSLVFAF